MFRKTGALRRGVSGAVLTASLLLIACGAPAPEQAGAADQASSAQPPAQTDMAEPAPPYRPAHDLSYLMEEIIQHHADTFWGSAGWVIDADGEHNLRPTTEERWADVVASAATLAQLGNVLMIPAYSEGRNADWFQFSGALVEMGLRAQAAAEARDEEAIFDTGAILYRVCEGCHIAYPPTVLSDGTLDRPSAIGLR